MNPNNKSPTDNPVRVAIRIRPQPEQEVTRVNDAHGPKFNICVKVKAPSDVKVENQLHKFKFDIVLGPDTTQEQMYNHCLKNLVDRCFSGFNTTVLACGDSGSGKSYTLGTGFELSALYDDLDPKSQGFIPRVINQLFEEMDNRIKRAKQKLESQPTFFVTVQYLQLYENKITNLLDEFGNSNQTTNQPVSSAIEALKYLQMGCYTRAKTCSNSIYDAVFAITVHQSRTTGCDKIRETLTARFNFIDLAARERSETSDSKLMKLLHNSLGQDNRAILVGCINPQEVLQTLDTLTLADKAKNLITSVPNNEINNDSIDITPLKTPPKTEKQVNNFIDHFRQFNNFEGVKKIANHFKRGSIYDLEWEDGSIRRFKKNRIPQDILLRLRNLRHLEMRRKRKAQERVFLKEMKKQREQLQRQTNLESQNGQNESLYQTHVEKIQNPPIIFSPLIKGLKMKITPRRRSHD